MIKFGETSYNRHTALYASCVNAHRLTIPESWCLGIMIVLEVLLATTATSLDDLQVKVTSVDGWWIFNGILFI